jgi:Emfourin
VSGEPFRIEFERSGGVTGISRRATIDSTQLDPAKAAELDQLLTAAESAAGPGGADRFQYDLKISRGGQERSVTLRDGSLTDDQKRLVALLTELAKAS